MARLVKCGCGQVLPCVVETLGVRGTCPWCGVPLEVAQSNSRLVAELPDGVPPLFVQAAPAPIQKNCARCGRVFRGDWDRNATNEGVLCHVCSNQWRPPPPEQESNAATVTAIEEWNPPPLSGFEADAAPVADDGFQSRFRTQRAQERRALWMKWRGPAIFVGIAAFAILLIALLPVEEYVANLLGSPEKTSEPAISRGAVSILLWGNAGLFTFLGQFVGLYAGLAIIGSLPNETLKKNLIAVGTVAFGLTLLNLLAFFPLWGILVVALRIAIIFALYDLDTGDILPFYFTYFIARLATSFACGFIF